MVEVELELEEYERILRWFGLIFGKGGHEVSPEDEFLIQKLAMMNIAKLKNKINQYQTIKNILKDLSKDDEK